MRAVVQLVSLVAAVFVLPPAVVLLLAAVTWQGRGFAAGIVLMTGAILIAAFGRTASFARRRRMAMTLGAIGLASVAAVVARAPAGRARSPARVQHLYAGGEGHARWTVANVVPEIDQLMMGFVVMPFVDPLLTHRQVATLRRWTREIYRELEADPEFRALGSTMSHAYADSRGGDAPQHAFLYVPATVDRTRPAPTLVFFHGSGGNFKAYVWLISRMADRLNLVVIAPSFGAGNWTADETRARTTDALAAAERIVAIDRSQVHAIGLSNGGLALTQLLAASAGKYRSFIFLSPVFADEALSALAFGSATRPKPAALIVTGALDDRVPLAYVEDAARKLRKAGANVTFETFDTANHFLFFSHREQVIARLEAWLGNAFQP